MTVWSDPPGIIRSCNRRRIREYKTVFVSRIDYNYSLGVTVSNIYIYAKGIMYDLLRKEVGLAPYSMLWFSAKIEYRTTFVVLSSSLFIATRWSPERSPAGRQKMYDTDLRVYLHVYIHVVWLCILHIFLWVDKIPTSCHWYVL